MRFCDTLTQCEDVMKFLLYFIAFFIPTASFASDLDIALQNTYLACIDIDDFLIDLKKIAGINTAVTAVGTGVGAGASAVGIAKSQLDAIEEEIQKLRSYTYGASPHVEVADEVEIQAAALANLEKTLSENDYSVKAMIDNAHAERLQKSRKLGNWRTGLLAANTATNIAGAAIAGANKIDDDLQAKINNCISAVQALNKATMVAHLNGEDISEATEIYNACREYEFVDISPINKHATGAMIASTVGAGVGLAGTITSGAANSYKIRNDNEEAGKIKEKNLNTASNVMAIGATAASTTATIFNATQIKAIKDVADIAVRCTEALK